MNTITDDHWGEEVWGAATAPGTTRGDTINSNLIFYWGQNVSRLHAVLTPPCASGGAMRKREINSYHQFADIWNSELHLDLSDQLSCSTGSLYVWLGQFHSDWYIGQVGSSQNAKQPHRSQGLPKTENAWQLFRDVETYDVR